MKAECEGTGEQAQPAREDRQHDAWLDDQGFGHRFAHPQYINAMSGRMSRREDPRVDELEVRLRLAKWRWVSEQKKRRAWGPAL